MSVRVMHRIVQQLPTYLMLFGAWIVLVAIAFFEFGIRPKTLLGWIALIVLGPLAVFLFAIIGECLGELFRKLPGIKSTRAYVAHKTQGKKISGLRIGWLFVEMILFFGVVFGLAALFRLL